MDTQEKAAPPHFTDPLLSAEEARQLTAALTKTQAALGELERVLDGAVARRGARLEPTRRRDGTAGTP